MRKGDTVAGLEVTLRGGDNEYKGCDSKGMPPAAAAGKAACAAALTSPASYTSAGYTCCASRPSARSAHRVSRLACGRVAADVVFARLICELTRLGWCAAGARVPPGAEAQAQE
eukprot:5503253-Pyramimonas_sp.AAC.2